MGTYLNPGNGMFQTYLNREPYVDKTGLIGAVNRYMVKKNNCICVARPRRFGKSYAADMLAAYYSRGCDSRALFENLKIARDPSFEEHLNKYDVFQINIADVINMTTDAETGIARLETDMCDDLKEAYPDMDYRHEGEIQSMLTAVYQKTGTKFVFVIDEWDCPMRERKDDEEGQKLYLHFLRGLLKDKKYLVLAYMTGILPMKMNGTQSEANMFDEFTMMDCSPMQEYFGFTEDEVRGLCEERGRSFDEMREWYDGYDVDGVSIYNPRSVSRSLSSGKPGNYWTHTETYEDLKGYINDNRYGIHDVIVQLLMGDPCPVNPDLFANDLVTLECLDDILTLLVHLGYLTYDGTTGRVRIPNLEIRKEFIGTIKRMKPSPLTRLLAASEDLLDATLNRDEAAVADGVARMHDSYHETPRKYNSEDELEAVVRFAYIYALNQYEVESEPPAGKGYADLVFTPVSEGEVPAMVIELEAGRPASEAIAQIKERRYVDRLGSYRGEVYLVGISYDVKSKVHECLIEVIER